MGNVVASASTGTTGIGFTVIWMVVIFGLLYFMMIRPQKKEQKRVSAMLSNM